MNVRRHETSLALLFTLLSLVAFGCSETVTGNRERDSGTGGDSPMGGDGDGDGDGDVSGDGDATGGTSGDGDGDSGDGDASGDGDGDATGGTSGDGDATGGTSGDGDGDGTGGSVEDDTDAPTVVSTTPEDGDVGVHSGDEVVIEFSEAMDTQSTEAAFSKGTLPGTPTFVWSDGDTTLTITFDQSTTYAEGTTTNVTALAYDFSLAESATDLAGNRLAALDVSFTTLRRIATTLLGVPELDGFAPESGQPMAQESDAVVGFVPGELVTFLTFDTSTLPDNIAEFESATLGARQTDSYQDKTPYALFGDLFLHHTLFDAVEWAAVSTAPLRNLGVFSTAKGAEWRFLDVRPALREDYSLRVSRQNRSQYWLRFAMGPGGSTGYEATAFYMAEASTYPPRIDVIYLLP